MSRNKSQLDKIIDGIIDQYLKDYFSAINSFDAVKEERNSAEGYESRQQITDEFNNRTGIVGGAIIFANNSEKEIVILQEGKSDAGFSNYYHPKWVFNENGDSDNDIANKKKLIQLLVKGTSIDKNFGNNNILTFPKYFINLPPFHYPCSPGRSEFEKDVIREQNINYLFCLVEEILFFNYMWRYLMRCALIYGLEFIIDTANPPSYNEEPEEILEWQNSSFFENFKKLPEAIFAAQLNQSDDVEFKKYARKKAAKRISGYDHKLFDIETEWINLGIWPKASDLHNRQLTLINLRQLLKYTEEISTRFKLDARLPAEYKIVTDILQIIEINTSEYIDKTSMDRVSTAIGKIAPQRETLHAALIQLGLTYLTDIFDNETEDRWVKDLNLEGDHSIGNLLSILHSVSRFPILTNYFLTIMHNNSVVYDYFVFPILTSLTYPIESINFSAQPALDNANGHTMLSQVALVMVYIEPIWMNKLFTESNFILKTETLKTVEGFKLNQLFYSRVSRDTLDQGFYGNYFRQSVKLKERDENFEIFHHNSKLHLAYISRMMKTGEYMKAKEPFFYIENMIELSRYAFTPKDYVEQNKKRIRKISLSERVYEVRDYIMADLIHNSGNLINIGSEVLLKLLISKVKNDKWCDCQAKGEYWLESYPEIIEIILKDVLGNAVANGPSDEQLVNYPEEKPLVHIGLSQDKDTIWLVVKNYQVIPNEFKEVYEGKEYLSDEKLKVPWGILITSNYCKELGFIIKVAIDENEPSTSIKIGFKNS